MSLKGAAARVIGFRLEYKAFSFHLKYLFF